MTKTLASTKNRKPYEKRIISNDNKFRTLFFAVNLFKLNLFLFLIKSIIEAINVIIKNIFLYRKIHCISVVLLFEYQVRIFFFRIIALFTFMS